MKASLFSLLAALAAMAATASPMVQEEAQAGCNLTGTYVSGSDISTCDNVVISSLTVPAGVTLDLTKTKAGATITFQGTTTFGTEVCSSAGLLTLLSSLTFVVSSGKVRWST